MKIVCYGNTDTGLVRDHNEDAFYISDSEPLYVVADGMGGHNCGELASRIAVETIAEYYAGTNSLRNANLMFKGSRKWPFAKKKPKARTATYEELRLETSIQEANKRIIGNARKDSTKKGMGTTLVAAFLTDSGIFLGHVGDSRCYRLRDGQLERMTLDHSLANEYVKLKILAPEDVESFPYKNVIVRALGLADSVEVDVHRKDMRSGDLFVLCSDGLSDMLPDKEICRLLNEIPDVEDACEELIESAREAGGADNITVVVAKVEMEESDNVGHDANGDGDIL